MFNCEICEYSTDSSSNLKKHLETKKHVVCAHKKLKEKK